MDLSARPRHGYPQPLAVIFATAILLAAGGAARADDVGIQEVSMEEQAAELGRAGHFSLLGDGHNDKILRVDAPSGSFGNSHYLVLAGRNFLVPIERREGNYQEAGYDTQSFFNSSIHGDCTHADARFFRKIVDGRIAGFYAIQSTVDLDLSHDIQGVDDFRNATVVYELFRFERRQSDAQWQYPRFRKVAEKRIVVQECDQAEIGHDIVELIRDY